MKKDERARHSFTIGEAMDSLLKAYRLEGKFNEAHLITNWEDIIGKPIASRTNKVFVKNKVLFVELNSAPLKHELNHRRSLILHRIQEQYGSALVQDIVFM